MPKPAATSTGGSQARSVVPRRTIHSVATPASTNAGPSTRAVMPPRRITPAPAPTSAAIIGASWET